jgi:hypothetical protein
MRELRCSWLIKPVECPKKIAVASGGEGRRAAMRTEGPVHGPAIAASYGFVASAAKMSAVTQPGQSYKKS